VLAAGNSGDHVKRVYPYHGLEIEVSVETDPGGEPSGRAGIWDRGVVILAKVPRVYPINKVSVSINGSAGIRDCPSLPRGESRLEFLTVAPCAHPESG
jgi:hypothetical protein